MGQTQTPMRRIWSLRRFLPYTLLVPLTLAMVECSNQRELAREAAFQTYNLERVAAFRDSGGALDRRVAAFFDAAAAGRPLEPVREQVRDAFVTHATAAEALKGVLDEADTDRYLAYLAELSDRVEQTKDATLAGPNITALARVVKARNDLAKSATLTL